MRQIKFRGFSKKENKWVYGYLVYEPPTKYSSNCVPFIYIPVGKDYGKYEVDPDSVGQYTGLKDKNKKEIYEGDIVKHNVSLDGKVTDSGVVGYLGDDLNPRPMFAVGFNGLHEFSGLTVIGNKYEGITEIGRNK